jgi:hypothetical protein
LETGTAPPSRPLGSAESDQSDYIRSLNNGYGDDEEEKLRDEIHEEDRKEAKEENEVGRDRL